MTFCGNSLASQQILQGLFDSQETQTERTVPEISIPTSAPRTQVMTSAVQCLEKDQNSLPLKYFMGLLRNKGASLKPFHDSETSELTISGGPMIGNCNSMIEYKISEPGEGLPYVFQVKIKGCGQETCEYPVKKINASNEIVDSEKVKVAPTMNGFFECLKKTDVLKNGKINKAKIVVAEMKARQAGVDQSAELWFASHGPEAQRIGAAFSTSGNKLTRNDCFYFEDIQKDGFKIFSMAEREAKKKEDVFKQLCETNNYKLIDKRISEFSEVKSMQDVLIKVRNDLLVEEAKKIAKQIKESNDHSQLDAAKTKEVLEDYNKYIIGPLKDELFGIYENGIAIKEGLYQQINKETNQDKKAQLITLFMEKLNQLNKYTKPPFPSASTVTQMISFQKKAPIDDENWFESALELNETVNTVISYSLPYEKMLKRYQSRKAHKFTSFPSVNFRSAKRQIAELQGKFARELSVKRKMVSDSDYSRSRELSREASRVRETSSDNERILRSEIANIEEQMRSDCCYIRSAGTFDQQCMSRYYYRNLQTCVAELEEDLQSCYSNIQRLNKANDRIAQSLETESRSWVSVEKERDRYYQTADDDEIDHTSQTQRAYTYNPRSREQIRSSFDNPYAQRLPASQQQFNPNGPNPYFQQQNQFAPAYQFQRQMMPAYSQGYYPMRYQATPPFMSPYSMTFGGGFRF